MIVKDIRTGEIEEMNCIPADYVPLCDSIGDPGPVPLPINLSALLEDPLC